MWAMPATTVVNTIGAIIIRTSLMKPSPSGFIADARSGEANPNSTPRAMPARTWKYRLVNGGLRDELAIGVGPGPPLPHPPDLPPALLRPTPDGRILDPQLFEVR